jgi:hypothetical protein
MLSQGWDGLRNIMPLAKTNTVLLFPGKTGTTLGRHFTWSAQFIGMRNESLHPQLSASASGNRGSSWFRTAALAVCLLCLASCVPLLMGKKESGGEEKSADRETALIKPKLRDDGGATVPKISQAPSQLSDKPNKSGKAAASEDAEEFDDKPPVTVTKTPETPPKQDPGTEKPVRNKAPEKPAVRIAAGRGKDSDADPVLAEKTKDESSEPSAADPAKIDILSKKHDHSKYAEKIKKKAIDVVSKEPTCKFARLCQDTTTDQWDLSLYYLREKNYVLVAYAWDEIDEKWKESYTADKRPAAQWKSHLEYASGGKKCGVLKGSPPQ